MNLSNTSTGAASSSEQLVEEKSSHQTTAASHNSNTTRRMSLSPSNAPNSNPKEGTSRRRSSSIISHVEPETIEEQSDQASSPNLNADWVNNKGAWIVHIVIITILKVVYDSLPAISQETSWTLTNLTYVLGSYIMFHYVKGIPFEFNAGAYDSLTMWEQIDDGDQYTPTKKFLLGVPIGLFLISTHYTHYDLKMFIINCAACVFSVIPKLPSSHRLRLTVPEITVDE